MARYTGAEYVNSRSMPITNKHIYGSPTLSNNSQLITKVMDDTKDLANHNIVDRYDANWYGRFNRFGFVDPYNSMKNTKEYVFITKPDLNLIQDAERTNIGEISPFFYDALDRYKEVALQLQYSRSTHDGPFSQLLSNSINGPLELPGISADTIETGRNVYGTSISYRGSSAGSDKDFDFSLEFKDSRFLEVYMFFKMYDEYERLKWLGQVSPKESYIINRVLHDQVSIYKFIVADDGMTILYWARAIGCMPLSVPRDSMANINGDFTFSVNWKAQFISDMDPRILTDFNRITRERRRNRADLPLFNSTSKTAEGTWATFPYIKTRQETVSRKERFNKYYLFWTD